MTRQIQRITLRNFLAARASVFANANMLVAAYTNQPPSWVPSIPPIQFQNGGGGQVSQSLASAAVDPNNEAVTMSYVGSQLPVGVTFDPAIKAYRYDGAGPPGSTSTARLRATDNGTPNLSSDSPLHSIVVAAQQINRAPVLGAQPDIVLMPGQSVSLVNDPYFTDPDGDSMTVSVKTGSLPAGIALVNGVLVADGAATPGATSQASFEADDGVPDAPTYQNVTNLSLTSSVGGAAVPFTFCHPFREGDVPIGTSIVSATTANFQAIVKNRWPDGSAKIAICSGRAPLVAGAPSTFDISRGTPPIRTDVQLSRLQTLNPQASIQVGTFTVELQSLLTSPRDQFIAGPEMSEWRFSAMLSGSLLAQFDVRLYADDSISVLPTLQNGFIANNPGAVTGRVIVTVGGSVRYDSGTSRTIYHHQRLAIPTTECGPHWVGADPLVYPSHDGTYLRSTLMVPNYIATSATETQLNSFAVNWSFQGMGGLPGSSISNGGDANSIGWLPKWEAAYVVSGDSRAYRSTLRNSYATGCYSIHDPDQATEQPFSFSSYPTTGTPPRTGGEQVNSAYGFEWDPSHSWPPGYLAYLISGGRWHMEEAQHAAGWTYLWRAVYRNGVDGIIAHYAQPRGIGWAYRNLALATCITPDDAPQRPGYIYSLERNAIWHNAYQVNGLGWVLDPGNASDSSAGLSYPSGWRDSPFMMDFCAYSFTWAKQLKLLAAGGGASALDAFVARLNAGVVDRMAAGDPDKFHYRYRPYMVTYTAKSTIPMTHADIFSTWGECFSAYYGRANGADLDSPATIMRSTSDDTNVTANLANWVAKTAFDGTQYNYFEIGMSALALAVDAGQAGAQTAWTRITQATNWAQCVATLVNDTRNGVQPRT